MAAPQSTPLPPAPQRNESEDEFTSKSNTFVGALEPHRQELQAQADFVDEKVVDLDDAVNAAEGFADEAQAIKDSIVIPSESGEKLSFDSLTSAIIQVSANSGVYPDTTPIRTASYRSKSECDSLGIDYPDGGCADYVVVASGTGTDDGGSFIDAGGKQLFQIVNDGVIRAETYGAHPSPTIDSAPLINAALASAYKTTTIGAGVFYCNFTSEQSGLRHSILKGDGKHLRGEGQGVSELRLNSNQDCTLITNDRSSASSHESIKGLTINGNSENQGDFAIAFGLWISNCSNVTIDDVETIDTASFGSRVQLCDNVKISNINTNHFEEETADGFHFIDCNDVVGSNILVNTRGDDGFVIEANSRDVHDINISSLIVTAPVESTAAGKGVYLVNNEANGAAGVQREIRNININAVTHNCKANGLVLQRAVFKNINITHTDYGSYGGALLQIGDTSGVGVVGSIDNSTFNLSSTNATTNGLSTILSSGTISNNHLISQVVNPGDGSRGVSIHGDSWTADINVDYDPDGIKISPTQAIRIVGDDNCVRYSAAGGNSALRVEGSRNTFTPIKSTGFTVRDIEILTGADNNKFIGGNITSAISDSGIGTAYSNVGGCTNYGKFSGTTEASGGLMRVPHGLISAPTIATGFLVGNTVNEATVQLVNSSDIVFRVRGTDNNANVNSTAVTIIWEAKL